MKKHHIKDLILSALDPADWGAARALSVIMMLFGQRGRTHYDGAWHDPKLLVYKLEGKMANKVPIMFWGGSEYNGRKRKYYCGTVFDWLIDCCYYELKQNDPDHTLLSFLKQCGPIDGEATEEARNILDGILEELEGERTVEEYGIR